MKRPIILEKAKQRLKKAEQDRKNYEMSLALAEKMMENGLFLYLTDTNLIVISTLKHVLIRH